MLKVLLHWGGCKWNFWNSSCNQVRRRFTCWYVVILSTNVSTLCNSTLCKWQWLHLYLYDSALFLHINLFTKKDIDLFFAHTDSSSCGVSEQVWHSGFKALKEVGVQKAPEVEIIRVDIVPLPRRLGRQLATQRCSWHTCSRLWVYFIVLHPSSWCHW